MYNWKWLSCVHIELAYRDKNHDRKNGTRICLLSCEELPYWFTGVLEAPKPKIWVYSDNLSDFSWTALEITASGRQRWVSIENLNKSLPNSPKAHKYLLWHGKYTKITEKRPMSWFFDLGVEFGPIFCVKLPLDQIFCFRKSQQVNFRIYR